MSMTVRKSSVSFTALSGPVGRRTALGVLGGAIAAPMIGHAQDQWPSRPVRFICPFVAGGATDTLSRLYCQKMTEVSGQTFLVENRGGAGGDVGMDVLAKSTPDGYTIGMANIATHAISPTLKKGQLPFDAGKDFSFVSGLWWMPNMLVTNLDLPAKTVPELIELARKNPGKYAYASAGNGTTLHLSGELFKQLAGVDIVHVPYRGGAPAMVDLMAGRVHMMFDNIPGALAQYRPGKVRGLAVTSAERSAVVPDIPAVAETLKGYDLKSWSAVAGPAGLPTPIVERLAAFSKKALESPELVKAYLDLGATAWWTSAQELAAYRASEEKRLAGIIAKTSATVD
jgi:tripartite-type tricarboxylate transporter receptor subunit TctC